MMEHKVAHSVLAILLVTVAVFDIAEGILVLTGVWTSPVNYQGTPYTDATVSMLIAALVVGGSSLLAAATAFVHREWAVLVSVLAGLLMAGYLMLEAVSLDGKVGDALPTVLALQLFYFVLGLALFELAGSSGRGNIALSTSISGMPARTRAAGRR